jgi:hypothetical protein
MISVRLPIRSSYRPGRESAGRVVRRAVEAGVLLHASCFTCADCNKPAYCYDHRDYAKPLDVEPVCKSHNRRRGSALNNDLEYWNGIGHQGRKYSKITSGGVTENFKCHASKSFLKNMPEKSVADFLDEHWTTWELDRDLVKMQQEYHWSRRNGVIKTRRQTGTTIGVYKSFLRGLHDWYGVEPL